MLAWLKSWLRGPETDDGLGFSSAKELRLARRVWRLRRAAITWRAPTAAERAEYDMHAITGRFGDDTIALADIDGRRWVVRDRLWFGWPDPPEFVAIAFDGDEVWAAADFDNWPRKWTGVGLARSEAAGRHASVPE